MYFPGAIMFAMIQAAYYALRLNRQGARGKHRQGHGRRTVVREARPRKPMHLPVSSGTPRFAKLQLLSQLALIKTGPPSSQLLLYCHSIYEQASPIRLGSNAEQKLILPLQYVG